MLTRTTLRRLATAAAAIGGAPPTQQPPPPKKPQHRREDILDWAVANRAALRDVAALRWKETEGLVHYAGVAAGWVKGKLVRRKEEPAAAAEEGQPSDGPKDVSTDASPGAVKAKEEEEAPQADTGMAQYYQSMELRNTLKWKRVTWDQGADFEGFAARLQDNMHLFKNVPAFSYLSLHLVKDPIAPPSQAILGEPISYRQLQRGAFTAWGLEEGTGAKIENLSALFPTKIHRPPTYIVNWDTAEVAIADSASPYELLSFLQSYAAQLMHLQQRYAAEQEALTEMIENVRFRCTLTAIKFNKHDRSLRDDPDVNRADYIDPEKMKAFCAAMLSTAWLFRKHFKGLELRVGPPGSSYAIDVATRSFTIPCDFFHNNYRPEHTRYLTHEKIANSYRNHWYVWLLVFTFLVGDVDLF